jgi:glucose-1-phosphate cytidylyltransferase
MKVVILAGGKGTRLAEETTVRPKPMVEIGGKPLLWHLMKVYAANGFTEFLVACGYKGEMIKEYFHNFPIHSSDYFIDLATGNRTEVNGSGINWRVGLIDTGAETNTGGRILRLREMIGNEPFML